MPTMNQQVMQRLLPGGFGGPMTPGRQQQQAAIQANPNDPWAWSDPIYANYNDPRATANPNSRMGNAGALGGQSVGGAMLNFQPQAISGGGQRYGAPGPRPSLPPASGAGTSLPSGGAGGFNSSPPAMGGGGSLIRTGITAGPAVNPQWIQQMQASMRGYQPAAPQPGMQGRLGELTSQRLDNSALQLGRQGSYDNAQHLLASQTARSQAGLGWGGLQASDRINALQRNSSVINAIINMLMGSVNNLGNF